jgi:hypothetical protein
MTYVVTHRTATVDGTHRPAGSFETEEKLEAARWAVQAQATVDPPLTFSGTMLRSKPAGERGATVVLAHGDAILWHRNGWWEPTEGATALGDYGNRITLGAYTAERIATLKRWAGLKR